MKSCTIRLFSFLFSAILVLTILTGCGSGAITKPGSGSPTLTFSANSTSISSGQSVTLSWQTTNAASVTITASAAGASHTVTTSTQASGSVTDSPTQTTVYSAVAAGTSGNNTAPQTITVSVAQPVPPQVTSFTASPTSVSTGQTDRKS